MDRRVLLLAGAGFGLYMMTGSDGPALSANGPKVLVYVGARDCGPCLSYERNDRDGLRRAVRAKGWAYREAIAVSLGRLGDPATWPYDLAWARKQAGDVRGTPTFLLYDEGKLVRTAFGWGEAKRKIVPLVS